MTHPKFHSPKERYSTSSIWSENGGKQGRLTGRRAVRLLSPALDSSDTDISPAVAPSNFLMVL
jgi:hypothetical protein